VNGFDMTVWRFVARAAGCCFSTRVRLEDGYPLPHGATAPGNAVLIAAAVGLLVCSRWS